MESAVHESTGREYGARVEKQTPVSIVNTHVAFFSHVPSSDGCLVLTLIPYYSHNVHKHGVSGSHELPACDPPAMPFARLCNHTWYTHTVSGFHGQLSDELPWICR